MSWDYVKDGFYDSFPKELYENRREYDIEVGRNWIEVVKVSIYGEECIIHHDYMKCKYSSKKLKLNPNREMFRYCHKLNR